jgi:hypothetical protein
MFNKIFEINNATIGIFSEGFKPGYTNRDINYAKGSSITLITGINVKYKF